MTRSFSRAQIQTSQLREQQAERAARIREKAALVGFFGTAAHHKLGTVRVYIPTKEEAAESAGETN